MGRKEEKMYGKLEEKITRKGHQRMKKCQNTGNITRKNPYQISFSIFNFTHDEK